MLPGKMDVVDDTAPRRLKKSDYLKYLAGSSKVTDEAYKKAVDGCFGLLTERPCSAGKLSFLFFRLSFQTAVKNPIVDNYPFRNKGFQGRYSI